MVKIGIYILCPKRIITILHCLCQVHFGGFRTLLNLNKKHKITLKKPCLLLLKQFIGLYLKGTMDYFWNLEVIIDQTLYLSNV